MISQTGRATPVRALRLQKEAYDDGDISLLFLLFPHIS